MNKRLSYMCLEFKALYKRQKANIVICIANIHDSCMIQFIKMHLE